MSRAILFKDNDEPIYPCPYYPVGSVYISFNSTNPSTFFGGTWERIKGRFLLSADDETYKINNTGGEATHKLSVGELPNHNHKTTTDLGCNGLVLKWDNKSSGGTYWGAPLGEGNYMSSGAYALNTLYTTGTGSNQAHNNMPPYIVVYMWKRTG